MEASFGIMICDFPRSIKIQDSLNMHESSIFPPRLGDKNGPSLSLCTDRPTDRRHWGEKRLRSTNGPRSANAATHNNRMGTLRPPGPVDGIKQSLSQALLPRNHPLSVNRPS